MRDYYYKYKKYLYKYKKIKGGSQGLDETSLENQGENNYENLDVASVEEEEGTDSKYYGTLFIASSTFVSSKSVVKQKQIESALQSARMSKDFAQQRKLMLMKNEIAKTGGHDLLLKWCGDNNIGLIIGAAGDKDVQINKTIITNQIGEDNLLIFQVRDLRDDYVELFKLFDICFLKYKEVSELKKNTLVYCNAGQDRSALIIQSILLNKAIELNNIRNIDTNTNTIIDNYANLIRIRPETGGFLEKNLPILIKYFTYLQQNMD